MSLDFPIQIFWSKREWPYGLICGLRLPYLIFFSSKTKICNINMDHLLVQELISIIGIYIWKTGVRMIMGHVCTTGLLTVTQIGSHLELCSGIWVLALSSWKLEDFLLHIPNMFTPTILIEISHCLRKKRIWGLRSAWSGLSQRISLKYRTLSKLNKLELFHNFLYTQNALVHIKP